jgi:hypothetical protein
MNETENKEQRFRIYQNKEGEGVMWAANAYEVSNMLGLLNYSKYSKY